MENSTTHIEALYEKAKIYTNTTIELYKLNAIDTTADVVSSLASRAALVLVFSLFTLFVNIAVSLLIGNLLGAPYLGFLVVSLFYLVITILLFIYGKKYIQIPITNLVIAKLLKTKLSDELDYKTNNEHI